MAAAADGATDALHVDGNDGEEFCNVCGNADSVRAIDEIIFLSLVLSPVSSLSSGCLL